MVLRSMLYGAAVHSSHVYDQGARIVKRPLTEEDILELNDLFLTNGMHYIVVDTVDAGRLLILTLLASLNCYHAIAALTLEPLRLTINVHNVHRELIQNYMLHDEQSVDSFFVEQFYFDFMWIEMSDDLVSASWFVDFEQKLFEYKLENHLPIVCIRYAQE